MDLKELFKEYNISLSDLQCEMFDKYFNFLIQENEKYNLTGITEKNEVYIKHFLDSVLPTDVFKSNSNILDIGAGAGFPSVPLAILRPDLKFTLIDSVNKKVNFLNQLIDLLNLQNVVAYHTRCEDYAKDNREKYDYIVARAVASMNTLLEYMVPFAKVGGSIVMYKGDNYNQELLDCRNVIRMFHVKQSDILTFDLKEYGKRYIVVFNKQQTTSNKYPRGGNKPRLEPLH